MTSESNAKGMLAKLATLSCCVRRGSACRLHARGVGVLMLTCVGLVACSYRSLDRTALQEKTSVSAVPSAPASIANGRPSSATSETRRVGSAITTPLAEPQSGYAGSGAQAVRTSSVGFIPKHAAPSFDEVTDDASLTLSPGDVAAAAKSDAHHVVANEVIGAAASTEHAMAPAGNSVASMFHWGLLLGMVALIAVGGLGLALAFDNRRQRRQRMAAGFLPAFSVDQPLAGDVVSEPKQKEIDVMPSPVSDADATPVLPAPMATLLVEGRLLSTCRCWADTVFAFGMALYARKIRGA